MRPFPHGGHAGGAHPIRRHLQSWRSTRELQTTTRLVIIIINIIIINNNNNNNTSVILPVDLPSPALVPHNSNDFIIIIIIITISPLLVRDKSGVPFSVEPGVALLPQRDQSDQFLY